MPTRVLVASIVSAPVTTIVPGLGIGAGPRLLGGPGAKRGCWEEGRSAVSSRRAEGACRDRRVAAAGRHPGLRGGPAPRVARGGRSGPGGAAGGLAWHPARPRGLGRAG